METATTLGSRESLAEVRRPPMLTVAAMPFIPRIFMRTWSSPIQILLLSIMIGFANPLLAQSKGSLNSYKEESAIEGVVELNTPKGKAIALQGILVKLTVESPASGTLKTLTDSLGHFKFGHLAVGRYSLEVRSEGFIPFEREVVLGRDEMHVDEIRLQIERVVQEVEVKDRAGLTQVEGNAQRSTTFNSRQVLRLPLAQEKFREALPLTPGVIRTDDGRLHFNSESESQGMLLVDSAETVDPVPGVSAAQNYILDRLGQLRISR